MEVEVEKWGRRWRWRRKRWRSGMISESGLICPLLLTCLSLTQDHQIKADRRVGGFIFREEVGQIMMERLASINGGD